MNRSEMLDHVLHDDELESYKDALRARCIEELAARRRPKLRWIVAAAAALLIMTRLAFWPAPLPQPKPDYFVATVSLSTDQCVTTPSTVSIVTTHPSMAFARVKTTSSIDRLTDEEMLSMFAGVPCGLVGTEEDGKRLVFLKPDDEKRFLGKLGG